MASEGHEPEAGHSGCPCAKSGAEQAVCPCGRVVAADAVADRAATAASVHAPRPKQGAGAPAQGSATSR